MLLYMEIDGMRAQALQQHEPGLADKPLAVLSGRRLRDLSARAAGSGLVPGQEMSPAALIALGLLWRRDPGDSACAELQAELRQGLFTVARGVMECGIGELAIELWSLGDVPAAIAACRGIGWRVRAAAGESLRLAKARVRGGLPEEAEGGLVYSGERGDLPLAALDWLPSSAQRRLAALGLRTVGDVLPLGAGALWQQVGPVGRELWQFAQGEEAVGFRPLQPPQDLSWRRSYPEAACTNRLEIAQAVTDALSALTAGPRRLPSIGALELAVEDLSSCRKTTRRALLRPTRERRRLEAALLGMAITAVGGGVREICLRLVPATAETLASQERGLFYPVASAPKRRRTGPPPLEHLPGREQRLAYYDPYRRGEAQART